MARETFIDSLRLADRLLQPPTVCGEQGAEADHLVGSSRDSADLWLTPKSIEGFDPADFADWPKKERDELAKVVSAFRDDAESKPATKSQSRLARKHLERAVKIVRDHLLPAWLEAQAKMVEEAAAVAKEKGWYAEKDEKAVRESLLGAYQAPRLRIRTKNREVVLDPIARFGSGRRGIVDLVVMPTYETVYLIIYKDGDWKIVAPHGSLHSRPFSRATLAHTITKLSHE